MHPAVHVHAGKGLPVAGPGRRRAHPHSAGGREGHRLLRYAKHSERPQIGGHFTGIAVLFMTHLCARPALTATVAGVPPAAARVGLKQVAAAAGALRLGPCGREADRMSA